MYLDSKYVSQFYRNLLFTLLEDCKDDFESKPFFASQSSKFGVLDTGTLGAFLSILSLTCNVNFGILQ